MPDSPTTAVNPDLIPDELKAILAQRPDGPRPPLLGAMNGVQPPAQMSGAAPMRPPVSATPSVTPPPDPLAAPRGAFDASNQKLQDYTTQMMGTQNKLGQLQPPSQSNPDLKPKWWERLAGFGLGLTQIKDPSQAGAVAGNVVNRRFNAATQDYQSKRGALQDQLEAERAGLPALKDVNEGAWRTFQAGLDTERENRERTTGEGRVKALQDRADSLGEKFVAGSEERDEKSPTGWTAQTASGERKPFSPKSASTTPKEPKNADEALSAASAASDPGEKSRLLKLAKDLHQQEIDRVQQGRPDKNASYADKRAVQKEKDDTERRAKEIFDKATEGLKPDDEEYLRARGNYITAMQASATKYEQGIRNFGGTPEEITYDANGVSHKSDGSPAAQPGPATPAPSGNQSLPKAPTAGAQLSDKNVAAAYVKAAGGDKSKARELAKANGWKF